MSSRSRGLESINQFLPLLHAVLRYRSLLGTEGESGRLADFINNSSRNKVFLIQFPGNWEGVSASLMKHALGAVELTEVQVAEFSRDQLDVRYWCVCFTVGKQT